MSIVFDFTNDVSDNFYLIKIMAHKIHPVKIFYTFPFTIFTRFCSKLNFLHNVFLLIFLKCIFWFLGSQISPQVSDRIESHLLIPELAKRIDFPFLIFTLTNLF